MAVGMRNALAFCSMLVKALKKSFKVEATVDLISNIQQIKVILQWPTFNIPML
jgi:hypothetical protein